MPTYEYTGTKPFPVDTPSGVVMVKKGRKAAFDSPPSDKWKEATWQPHTAKSQTSTSRQ